METPVGLPSTAEAAIATVPGQSAAGFNSLAAPTPAPNAPDINYGPSGPSGGATMAQRVAGQAGAGALSSDFISNLREHSDKLTEASPEAAAGPGGWARVLVGGAQAALGGKKTGAPLAGLQGSMADAAHEEVGMQGLAKTMANRGARQAAQKKAMSDEETAQVLRAHTAAQTMQTLKAIGKQDETDRREYLQRGQDQVDAAVKVGKEAKPPMSHDELMDFAKSFAVPPGANNGVSNMLKQWDMISNKERVEVDSNGDPIPGANGKPKTDALVTLVKRTAEPMSMDQKSLDLAKKMGVHGLEGLTAGTSMPYEQYRQIQTQIDIGTAFKKTIDSASDEVLSTEKAKQLGADKQLTLDAATRYPGDPWKGLYEDRKNYDAHKQLYDTVMSNKNSTDADKQMAQDGMTEANKHRDAIDNVLASMPQGAIEAHFKLAEKEESDQEKIRVADDNRAEKAAEAKEKAALASAKKGDFTDMANMALSWELDPQRINRLTGDERAVLMQMIHKGNPAWSEAEYEERYQTKKDSRPSGPVGKQIQSVNTFLGHMGETNSLLNTVGNGDMKILNTPVNKIKTQFGNQTAGAVGAYKASLIAAKKEYLSFLNDLHVESSPDQQMLADLINESTPPSAAQAILRQMVKTAVIKAQSLNGTYRNVIKENYPGYLEADRAKVIRDFGIPLGDLQVQGEAPRVSQQQQQAPAAPKVNLSPTQLQSAVKNKPPTATGIAEGLDGKLYYHDIKNKNLGLAPDDLQKEK